MEMKNYRLGDYQGLQRKVEESCDNGSAAEVYYKKHMSGFFMVAVMFSAIGLAYNTIRGSYKSLTNSGKDRTPKEPKFFEVRDNNGRGFERNHRDHKFDRGQRLDRGFSGGRIASPRIQIKTTK